MQAREQEEQAEDIPLEPGYVPLLAKGVAFFFLGCTHWALLSSIDSYQEVTRKSLGQLQAGHFSFARTTSFPMYLLRILMLVLPMNKFSVNLKSDCSQAFGLGISYQAVHISYYSGGRVHKLT